jgi:hypothetical protein
MGKSGKQFPLYYILFEKIGICSLFWIHNNKNTSYCEKGTGYFFDFV